MRKERQGEVYIVSKASRFSFGTQNSLTITSHLQRCRNDAKFRITSLDISLVSASFPQNMPANRELLPDHTICTPCPLLDWFVACACHTTSSFIYDELRCQIFALLVHCLNRFLLMKSYEATHSRKHIPSTMSCRWSLARSLEPCVCVSLPFFRKHSLGTAWEPCQSTKQMSGHTYMLHGCNSPHN